MTPPTPYPNLSGHVHRLIIRNKTKKGHNLVCWHQKNYPYHTEFVSWRVHHFLFFIFFPIRWGGGPAPYWNFPIIFFFFFKPSLTEFLYDEQKHVKFTSRNSSNNTTSQVSNISNKINDLRQSDQGAKVIVDMACPKTMTGLSWFRRLFQSMPKAIRSTLVMEK